ncbi:hypothetical protein [Pseudaquabacterium rugosum]|uniref:Uncharacterized protein n=1 Tax=Pseudaquabacterium rugosum TaxID=2984194 RepID=A0ABU9BDF4_9BURK
MNTRAPPYRRPSAVVRRIMNGIQDVLNRFHAPEHPLMPLTSAPHPCLNRAPNAHPLNT